MIKKVWSILLLAFSILFIFPWILPINNITSDAKTFNDNVLTFGQEENKTNENDMVSRKVAFMEEHKYEGEKIEYTEKERQILIDKLSNIMDNKTLSDDDKDKLFADKGFYLFEKHSSTILPATLPSIISMSTVVGYSVCANEWWVIGNSYVDRLGFDADVAHPSLFMPSVGTVVQREVKAYVGMALYTSIQCQ